MKKILAVDIQPGIHAEHDYYSDRNELLIGKGMMVSELHLTQLLKRNIFELYINSSDEEEVLDILSTEYDKLDDIEFNPSSTTIYNGENISLTKLTEQNLEQLITSPIVKKLDHTLFSDTPQGVAFKSLARQIKVGDRTKDYLTYINNAYTYSVKLIKSIVSALLRGERDCLDKIHSIIDQLITIFLADKNILLNIANNKATGIEYLYCHSLNVCILSINIAAAYGYNREQIIEIGTGALLHDIGMFLIPEEIRYKNRRFSQEEWYEIKKHPILGLHLLEKLKDFPESAMYVAYQTHERQNQSGYPKQRGDNLIHRYAKIVQVADIYEALSSPRPHRVAILPFKSIENLIKMAKMNLISKNMVKAFIMYMSVHPIGSLVQLSNNCIAKVVDQNLAAINRPLVSVLIDKKGKILSQNDIFQINLHEEVQINIIKAIPFSQFQKIDIMDGF